MHIKAAPTILFHKAAPGLCFTCIRDIWYTHVTSTKKACFMFLVTWFNIREDVPH